MQHRSLPLADNFSLNAQLKILSGPLDAIVSEKYAENRGDARTLKERLAREFFPINDLINDSPLVPRKWITGDDAFDSFFQGGLPTRRIIELSGESGVGKTQLAIQLSMACQISQECGGLQGSTLYIKSESVFPTDRIYQMKRLFVEKENLGFSDDHQFADNIYFHHAINLPHLFDILEHQVYLMVQCRKFSSYPIRLIVIDSIAAFFRGLDLSFTEHTGYINKISRLLSDLMRKHSLTILVINQVSSNIKNKFHLGSGLDVLNTEFMRVIPCLGKVWTNIVHMRLYIKKCNDKRRSIKLVHTESSNHIPKESLKFSLVEGGLLFDTDHNNIYNNQ